MESELRSVVGALPALVWVALPDGRLEFLNHRWTEYTGLRVDDGYGRAWQAAIYLDDLPVLLERLRSPPASGEPCEIEVRVKGRSGEYRWFCFGCRPFTDASGRFTKWCGTGTDIDERKRAEENLRARADHYRSVADSIPALLAFMTPTGEVENVNRHTLDYFGVPVDEVKHWATADMVHREDLPAVIAAWTRSVEKGEPYEVEHRMRRADGAYRWFHVRGLPLRDAAGRIVRWHVLQTDIDDRRRAQGLLAGEKRFLEIVAGGHSMSGILEALCELVESALDGCACSAVLSDATGTCLEFGAAPSLPASFLTSIVGQPLNRDSGPCAMAAHLNEQVVAADLTTETRWRVHRWCATALAHGLQACWATPIPSRAGKALGAFAIYFTEPRTLMPEHRTLIEQFKHIASIAVERAQADAALKQSQVRKAAILDSALDCIVTIDHQACITEFNPAAERTFGYRREEVVGKPLADVIVPPAWREEHRKGFARHLATGEARVLGRRVEMTAIRADGSEFPVELTITRIPLDGPPSFTGYLRDITERKQTQESFRAIVETTPECVKVVARDGTLLRVNSAGLAISGVASMDLLLGQSFYDFVAPEDRNRYREFNERVCLGQKGFLEFEFITLQGERRQMETHAAPLRHEDGSVVQLGVSRDITARKQGEEKLRRSEAYLAEAQRLSLTGSFGWSISADKHYWSDETFRIFEYDVATKITLESFLARVHPGDLPLVRQVIASAADGADFDYECRLLMPSGSVKYLHIVAHRTSGLYGLEYIGAVQDITERRLSDEALGRVRSELAHVARVTSLGALTASIAHEVNQPLSGIITNAGTCQRFLAADPPNVDGARETAQRMIRDGHRASDVIKRLRALFAKRSTTIESVDLNEAAREVLALTWSELQRSGAVLQVELADCLAPVSGDRVQLQQVILNLVLNASEAMNGVHDRPRQLTIRTESEGPDRVRLTVQDTGEGLEPHFAEKLFEAFYTTKTGGMGIGLSISRSIIESHHGRLWGAPNDGPGATFAFSIPCAPKQVVEPNAVPAVGSVVSKVARGRDGQSRS